MHLQHAMYPRLVQRHHGGLDLIRSRALYQPVEPLVRAGALDPLSVFHDRLLSRQRLVHAPFHWFP